MFYFYVFSCPQPRDTLVTRWKNDPWARGSYSFVAVGASGNDYDLLSAPVSGNMTNDPLPPPGEAAKSTEEPHRLYFAGNAHIS
jgi:lysine-specific histone demethylase 1